MHTVRTRRLLREVCGPDTGSMTSMDRETVMPISLVLGIVVVVLLAGCQQSANKTSTATATPTRAQTKTVAERHFLFERLDHSVVNQHSTAHDSDLPGTSIAEYGK